MDKISKMANQKPHQLNELLFADDQSLIHHTQQELQNHINILNDSCKLYNMKINTEKTEAMTVTRTPCPLDVYVENKSIKQTKEFKYLGSIFTEDGKIDREIETRTQKANAITYQLSPLLTHANVSMNTKVQLIKSFFVPTLCYQSQTWTLNKSQERKIETCEMRCLRRVINKTRRDRIRNQDIRNIIGIPPCLDYIEQQRLHWFGHLVRMQHDQTAAQAYHQQYSGYKARGRPRKRWIDGVSEACQKQGLNIKEATTLAYERRLTTTLHGKSGR